jgi:hypothetical protein
MRLMTIKTQGGKVITKDGKVSCECCGPGCDEDCGVAIPQSIRGFLENATATSWTLYGLSPDTFNQFSPTEWNAKFEGEYEYNVGFFGGCLFFFLVDDRSPNAFIAQTGKEEFFCGPGSTNIYAKFTINGINDFDHAYEAETPSLYPTPVFVFT